MRYRHLWFVLMLIGFESAVAWAQELTPEQQKIQELERKIEDLDRRLRLAEGKTEGAELPQPAPNGSQRPTNAGVAAGTIPAREPNNVGLTTAGPGGFTVQSGDGDFLLRIGADLQTDIRTFTGKGS